MCPIKIEDIRIQHIIDSTKDYSTFAAARENSTNHLRIFLVNDSGKVYVRNGRVGIWSEILDSAAEKIRRCIERARNSNSVPVYKVNAAYTN